MEKVVNGYTVGFIQDYKMELIKEAQKNAIDAEQCGLEDIAKIWDETVEWYSTRSLQDISCKMIIRGVRRNMPLK